MKIYDAKVSKWEMTILKCEDLKSEDLTTGDL